MYICSLGEGLEELKKRSSGNSRRNKSSLYTLLVLICPVETCPFLKKEASFYRAT